MRLEILKWRGFLGQRMGRTIEPAPRRKDSSGVQGEADPKGTTDGLGCTRIGTICM
jgi:hypothetical protein